VLPKRQAFRIYWIATAMRTNTHGIPMINFHVTNIPSRAGVSFLCRLRQVSSVLSRGRGTRLGPIQTKRSFVTANFMAGQLHGPSGGASLLNAGSELRGTDTGP
jgi:hypothetical protein